MCETLGSSLGTQVSFSDSDGTSKFRRKGQGAKIWNQKMTSRFLKKKKNSKNSGVIVRTIDSQVSSPSAAIC